MPAQTFRGADSCLGRLTGIYQILIRASRHRSRHVAVVKYITLPAINYIPILTSSIKVSRALKTSPPFLSLISNVLIMISAELTLRLKWLTKIASQTGLPTGRRLQLINIVPLRVPRSGRFITLAKWPTARRPTSGTSFRSGAKCVEGCRA